jgi:hypothetical protein
MVNGNPEAAGTRAGLPAAWIDESNSRGEKFCNQFSK